MKEVIIFGGANGSGKTTFAKKLIDEINYYFLNADEIEDSFEEPRSYITQVKAGRLFFDRLNNLLEEERSFILESTLSGKYLIKVIEKARKRNYNIKLIYIFLENPNLCIERIKVRVKLGGHFVPDEDVKRRYYRSKENFWNNYKFLSDNWAIFYNSTGESIELVASGIYDRYIVLTNRFFEKFLRNSVEVAREELEDLRFYQIISKWTRKFDKSVYEVKSEIHKNGLPIVFTRNGKIYYELPNGEVTNKSPLKN